MSECGKDCLMQRFKNLKAEYVRAFKLKLHDLCLKLGDQMMSIAERLQQEFNVQYAELGLSDDAKYILRCVSMVAVNPTSKYADTLLGDAQRLKCESCNGTCESTPIMRTMENFVEIIIHPDGTRSFPEPEPVEIVIEQPYQSPRRNCDIQREMRGES